MLRAWLSMMRCAIALGIVPLAIAACSKKDSAQDLSGKSNGRGLEQADSEESGDAAIRTKSGDVEMLTSDDWPAGMFVGVPTFRYGRIVRVSSAVEGGLKKFTVWFRDVAADACDRYLADLNESGWTSRRASMGEQGETITATKGKIAVQFLHGMQDHSGVFSAYEVSE